MRKYVAFAELPEWQRAIGKRVRTARIRFKLSQAKLANLIGLTRDQLNNVELGRVALRFQPGWNLCLQLDLNPAWLLSGDGERHGFVDLSGMNEVPDDVLFSDLMENLSAEDVQWPGYSKYREDSLRSSLAGEARSGDELAAKLGTLTNWLKHVSPKLHSEFWTAMAKAARDFVGRQNKYVSDQLTKQIEFGKVGSMNLQKVSFWHALRERIRKLVQKRGMKSALARDIGVSRQAINSLLKKKRPYVPSAEYALRLSKWVEVAEAKQSAGVSAPAQKIRRKLNYEKDKPTDRKKR